MSPERFLEQFGHLADAPNGIAKLRELILQLAVRGKLVPQDPEDEPASALLEKIRAEKERLVAEGKIKKAKPLQAFDSAQVPFPLPDSWTWLRLEDVFYPISVSKNKVKTSEIRETGSIPVVDQGQTFVAGYVDRPDLEIKIDGPVVIFGDHTTALKYVDFDFVAGADGVKILRPIGVDEEFFFLALKTLPIENRGYGRHYRRLIDNFFPLAPLPEQSRIVAKVDQLMALCDELEAKQNQRSATHVHLIRAAHQPLTQPRDHAEFQTAWQRIRDNFDGLHTTVDSVKALRQTILQLAVQGKLVPQDPNDEPANVLLEKISAEKERLVAEGKIKKMKPILPMDPEQVPFELPQAWRWELLGSLIVFGPRNGYSPRPVEYATDVKTLTLTAITSGTFDRNQYKFLDIEVAADSHLWLEDGDILIQRANTIEYVGVSAIYRGSQHEYIYPDLIMKIRAAQGIDVDFLHLVLLSSAARDHMRERATGTSGSMPKVNQQTVNSIPVPVAPLKHQKKVVAKVDQLMVLCDKLEAKIEANQTTAQQFAEAVEAELAA